MVAYTFDSGLGPRQNIYFALNAALRKRKTEPSAIEPWKGYLFFLLGALAQLPSFKGTVFRGGNHGLDQATVRDEYTLGRPIQWAVRLSCSGHILAMREEGEGKEGKGREGC